MDELIKCAIYIRVSSDEQAKFGDSLRDQQERCADYIKCHNNMILHDIYIDDGVSGQKLDRGEFGRLINAAKSEEINLIIFTKLDRWFRNLRHYLNTQAVLESHSVAWTAIDQAYFDTSTPHGRAFVAQSMMWAELEAQNDGIRIRDVFKNKVKYGEVITGKVPRGYKIEDRHLVLSEESPIILDCFEYFLKCHSLHASVKYLHNQYGIDMTLNNFKNSILRNEKYVGKYRDNLSYCPQIISDEVFSQVQQVLDQNINIKSGQRYPYIFSGLVVCNECGYKMGGCHINVISKRKSGKQYRYRYPAYECKQYHAYKKCDNGGEIREARIEEYMLSHIRLELNAYIAKFDPIKKVKINNCSQKGAIKKKLDRLKELYLNEIISLNEYKTDRLKFEAELNSITDIVDPPVNFVGINRILDNDFESLYASFDNKEKRRFWRSILREIRVSKSIDRKRSYEIIF